MASAKPGETLSELFDFLIWFVPIVKVDNIKELSKTPILYKFILKKD